jgi:multicomponent Na+:H+ antiporter subunit G
VSEALRTGAADALVVLGVLVMTVGVYGLLTMPDVYTQLHAASKAVFLGVIALLAATALVADEATIVYRAVLIAVFLLITTPVSAHAVGHAAQLGAESAGSRRLAEEGSEVSGRQGDHPPVLDHEEPQHRS